VPAQYYLGTALLHQWQGPGALAAFEQATKANANHPHAWLGLSAATLMMHRDAQSGAAFARALSIESNPEYYLDRAYIALRIGRNDVAAEAAQRYVESVGLAETSAQYAAFLGAVARRRAGHAAEADAVLAAAQSTVRQGAWTASVLEFLRGQLDASQLLDKAKTNGQRTEAHTYIGLTLNDASRREEAVEHLRWVVERGAKNYTEYALARNELARLRHDASQK
jgi:tetratricopeptide (TPR) repeat protein